MDLRTNVDPASPAAQQVVAEARRSGSAALSWSSFGARLRCVVGWPGDRPALAEVLPLFEHLGLRLIDHDPVGVPEPTGDVFTFDASGQGVDDEAMALLGEAFLAAWEGRCDRDDFAVLAPVARLHARQVQLVRVAFAYLSQAGLGLSRAYARDILLQHPAFVRAWVELFESRFDPSSARDSGTRATDQLDVLLEQVTTRDVDRLLRWFAGFLRATLRTSYFRHLDDAHAGTITVKLNPSLMPFLMGSPAFVETFVHHPDVEGLHVRYGLTARGGLRWSDRLEDYRTEVLALVRAQQVKNAPIVPAGAKGAYVVKRPLVDLDPDAAAVESRRCYRMFVRGLLDITDTIVGGVVRHPPDTVVLDGDDTYLVVAADKGTAAFSDLANAEAAEVGFWLGDAFASGGSSGYDHKALGVTARGAWVAVRRHFAELGLDVDQQPFTVAGIGDMSGDVFGNGMLLSSQIRLVAAFDHRHIFLDPDPDPAGSFSERRRLAALRTSSWADYDPAVLSVGGSIHPRTVAQVLLTLQVRRRLGVDATSMAPDDLIRAILRSPVDLLWNGGIGTYVRASLESDGDVGDRANHRVRVQADELRCRVVAEGGNLGLTQAARIEYALGGGRVNADFIDNAGGVNTSDREVNLKILLSPAVQSGTIDLAERNRILDDCAADVVDAVLADNARQTRAISVAEAHGPFLLDRHDQVIRNFEEATDLDRSREQLPSNDEVGRRRAEGRGLVRPEIAVLLSHAKNLVRAEVADSDVPEDEAMAEVLLGYFPDMVRSRFEQEIRHHRLAREIVCTRLANDLIDHLGPGFLYGIEHRAGATTPETVRAYLVVRDLLGLDQIWRDLDASQRLADTLPLRLQIERTLEHNVCWLLHHPELADSTVARERLGPPVRRLLAWVEEAATSADSATSRMSVMFPAFDLAIAAAQSQLDVVELARGYLEVGQVLDLDWLTSALLIAPADAHLTQQAKAALADDLCATQVGLGAGLLRAGDGPSWQRRHAGGIRRFRMLSDEVDDQPGADMAAMTLALRRLQELLRQE